MTAMQQYFSDISDYAHACLHEGEEFTAWFAAEQSDFVRFNHGRVRQAGAVRQLYFELRLLRGCKHVSSVISLSGRFSDDSEQLQTTLKHLRNMLADAVDDPHVLINREPLSSERAGGGYAFDAESATDCIARNARDHDLVGILAAGPVYRGFANSLGQRNWHQTGSFSLDWSLYAQGDKAIKSTYGGSTWSSHEFGEKMRSAQTQLELLRRPAKAIPAGNYRTYLTPRALSGVVSMLSWGGFSEKSLRTKQGPLMRLASEQARFSEQVSMVENSADGLAPSFQGDGFSRPGKIPLITDGRLTGSLVSPRTAVEYGVQTNGFDGDEAPQSLQVAAGDLPQSQVLAHLGTGIYISDLWYVNFSDVSAGRLTGMTRFATFWVEDGEIQAPLNVMRFDDTLYRILGSELQALTAERELLIDSGSYGARQLASQLMPGALLRQLRLVS